MELITFPAHLDALESIGKYILETAQQAGLLRKKAYKLRLAVDELVTNIINYGYAQTTSPTWIKISATQVSEGFKVTIIDRGLAYDPREHTFDEFLLSLPAEERPIGGLGIFLALRNVDEFDYQTLGEHNVSTLLVYPDA